MRKPSRLLVVAVLCCCAAVRADNWIIGAHYLESSRFTWERVSDSGAILAFGNLEIGRARHIAIRFSNSRIFLAGGTDDSTNWQIRDLNTMAVLNTGFLVDRRVGAAAAVLQSGNIFIVGGDGTPGTWEIRRGTDAGLVASGNTFDSRNAGVRAVTLANGNVFIAGSGMASPTGGAATWEIRSPTGSLVSQGNLQSPRGGAQAFLLASGNVVLFGGGLDSSTYEVRSPTGGFVSSGILNNSFDAGSRGVKLGNGNFFLFGRGAQPSSTWEIRNGTTLGFVAQGVMQDARSGPGGVVLLPGSGNVLITGGGSVSCPDADKGSCGGSGLSTWEIRSPTGAFVSSGVFLNTHGAGHSVTH